VRDYVAFWREYPDLFVDFMEGEKSTFNLFFYQRIFLRAAMRHKYLYATFPRAYSKSFLSMLILMIRCILYPGAHLFVTSGGKEQSAGIIKEKVQEICRLIPAFDREIDYRQKKTTFGKDYVQVVFKNGSYFDNIAARETSRGKRRHGGVMEEAVGIDGKILSEVIIPIMNISRSCVSGETVPEETVNKSQIYITTAGWKNTFAYDKLIQILVCQAIKPEKYIVLGGSWKIPVLMKLLDKNFIQELELDGTFNEASFGREYCSEWSGSGEDSFFREEIFNDNRKLLLAETEALNRSKASHYVLSADIGRKGCDTVVCVFKVIPQPQGASHKSLVNIYTYSDMHIEDQVLEFKKLFYKYRAKTFVIDGNGIGINFVDLMIKPTNDATSGEVYPGLGVINDEEGYYKQYRTSTTHLDTLYIIKANAALNTEMHSNVQAQLMSGKIKFLIDEKQAKAKLMSTQKGKDMTPEQRADYLRPYTLTSILKEEMLNLREEHEGININLKQANPKIKKDKFSSLEYGLYYIKKDEESRKRRKNFNIKDLLFIN